MKGKIFFLYDQLVVHPITKCSPDAGDSIHHSKDRLSQQLWQGVRLPSGTVGIKQKFGIFASLVS